LFIFCHQVVCYWLHTPYGLSTKASFSERSTKTRDYYGRERFGQHFFESGCFVNLPWLFDGIGIYQGMKAKNTTDFNMGGRDVPGWAAALSERATGESACVWSDFQAMHLLLACFCLGCSRPCVREHSCMDSTGNKMRKEADHYDAQTYVDWIAKRHAKSKSATAVRLFGSFIVIFLFAFYVEAR
jgi:hypothetical protein